ncbi:MAG: S8 family serine peptidase [Ignavibacteriales bacterium]|nr:S8 family serine peptidase [Ignavibacteriales bacterium]
MRVVKYLIIILISFVQLIAQDSSQTFLSLRNTGVEAFQNKYPDYDGRGTIILVLDTGVDMGVDGLTKTSTGEVKVIDVQDFTGQGDIQFYEAEIDEENDTLFFINEEHNIKVAGAGKLKYSSKDDNYFIGVIKESLWKNSGSGASDVNGNGSENDEFVFVTFEVNENSEKYWVVFLDTNSDGDLTDEKPLRNYKENLDSFVLPNKNGLPQFTLGLNIFPENNLVSFYFDDGSHGTHCAGIAAGNRIGETDLFGVAPGAKVIGLKLGNNNLSGGATVAESMKKAYLYADKISKEKQEPCIINMSFGVGSEIEGQSEIETFLERLVERNPYLYISTSNGNEGPGLSTSGMPSASNAIFSTGAVLSKEVGNDLYGTTLDKDIILHFSSRGGEVSKPDVVAPGACVSTVPNFSRGDRFWGTSMASPYSAGVMAVLLGAAKSEFPDIKIPSQLIYKVLRESAVPMEDYLCIDQGKGLINIENAYNLLKEYIKNSELKNFETYSIKSFAPNMPNNYAPNLYIRDASYLNGDETFYYRVSRNNFNDQDKFYRIYNLKSNADWLKVIQKKVHIRNDQPVYIEVQADNSILKNPGLYNARIDATRADKTNMPEFDMMATIIVPYEFNTANNYNLYFENENLNPGMHKRYFLKIPNGTSNLNIKVTSGKNDFTSVRYYLHDPDGREKIFGTLEATSDAGEKISYVNNLEAGVYEFVILGQFTSSQKSTFNIDFNIDGINILGHSISKEKEITVVNYFSKSNEYDISGKVLGYKKDFVIETKGEKSYTIPIVLNEGESKKSFDISLEKDVFNKVTDFALMIYDKNGKAVEVGGMSYKDESITVERSNAGGKEIYSFELIPGFANEPSDISINVSEKTYFTTQTDINIANYKNSLTMYPDQKYKLICNYELLDITLPEGSNYFGELYFKSVKSKDVEFTKTINISN